MRGKMPKVPLIYRGCGCLGVPVGPPAQPLPEATWGVPFTSKHHWKCVGWVGLAKTMVLLAWPLQSRGLWPSWWPKLLDCVWRACCVLRGCVWGCPPRVGGGSQLQTPLDVCGLAKNMVLACLATPNSCFVATLVVQAVWLPAESMVGASSLPCCPPRVGGSSQLHPSYRGREGGSEELAGEDTKSSSDI